MLQPPPAVDDTGLEQADGETGSPRPLGESPMAS